MSLRRARERDRERINDIRRQAFNQQSEEWRERNALIPIDSQRVWEQDGRIVAACTVREFGHFLGGNSVGCAGISGVVVAAEARGQRIAERLVGSTLIEYRSETPISSLFPATVPLYRRLGYEYGFVFTEHSAPIAEFPRFKDVIPLEPFSNDDLEEVAAAYRSYASKHNGLIDRPEKFWDERLLRPFAGTPLYAYIVREEDRITGLIVYTQEDGFDIRLQIKDMFYTTSRAARSLLTFIARYDSLGKNARWHSAPVEPLQVLFREQPIEVKWRMNAMVRVLDVQAALQARGYDDEASGSVTFEVHDDLIPENHGPWSLRLESGKAFVEPAEKAAAKLSVNALSAIYTGFLKPATARTLGLLDASDADVRGLEGIFEGPTPWLTDFF
ncbi:MAG: GNAT family N-acetyltransferase [Actinomycetota bacterium]